MSGLDRCSLRTALAGLAAIMALAGRSAFGQTAVVDPRLRPLIADLAAAAPERQKLAATKMFLMGPAAKAAVPALLKATEDRDPYVRQFCLHALGGVVPGDPGVLRAATRCLHDPEWFVVSTAAAVVGTSGPAGRAAVADLKPLLTHFQPYVRTSAASALWRIEHHEADVLPVFLEVMRDRDRLAAAEAVGALGALGEHARQALPELRALVAKSPSSIMGTAAVRTLGEIGPAAREAIPDILACLKSLDAADQRDAIDALAKIAPNDDRVTRLFQEQLDNADLGYTAAEALARVGRAAVPILLAVLQKGNQDGRKYAAMGLGRLGPDALDAIPALMAALPGAGPGLQTELLKAIGKIGTDDPRVAEQIMECARTVGIDSNEALATALDGLGPKALPVLVRGVADQKLSRRTRQALLGVIAASVEDPREVAALAAKVADDPEDEIREDALKIIANLGTEAPGVIEALVRAVHRHEPGGFPEACRALKKLGPKAKAFVPPLVRLIHMNPQWWEVRDAAEALGYIGTGDETVPAVLHEVAAKYPEVAGVALWRLGKRDPALVESLVGRLEAPPFAALEALGDLAAEAKAAVPAVERLLSSPEENVRLAAAVTLWKIDRKNCRPGTLMLVKELQQDYPFRPINLLASMGRDAPEAAPALEALLSAKDAFTRVLAAKALWAVDPGRGPVILETLSAVLADHDNEFWHPHAIEGLAAMGPAAKTADALLRQKTRAANPKVRRAAVRALAKINAPGVAP
ncbi:MAG: HEAT repeat domain-containing protein [Thermoguttaceae bacterium]